MKNKSEYRQYPILSFNRAQLEHDSTPTGSVETVLSYITFKINLLFQISMYFWEAITPSYQIPYNNIIIVFFLNSLHVTK